MLSAVDFPGADCGGRPPPERIWLTRGPELFAGSACELIGAPTELEMCTPGGVQVNAQAKTLDFQGVMRRTAVKIMTFVAFWQDFDARRDHS